MRIFMFALATTLSLVPVNPQENQVPQLNANWREAHSEGRKAFERGQLPAGRSSALAGSRACTAEAFRRRTPGDQPAEPFRSAPRPGQARRTEGLLRAVVAIREKQFGRNHAQVTPDLPGSSVANAGGAAPPGNVSLTSPPARLTTRTSSWPARAALTLPPRRRRKAVPRQKIMGRLKGIILEAGHSGSSPAANHLWRLAWPRKRGSRIS